MSEIKGIVNPTLGWDENATWTASQRTPGQIVDLARHFDGVISPYYMFMHFWTAVFGDSIAVMRLPSLIAVVAGVGLVGELGRRLFGGGIGLVAGLIVVVGVSAIMQLLLRLPEGVFSTRSGFMGG